MTEGSVHHLEAELFRTLGHAARARVPEALAAGALAVGDVQAAPGLGAGATSAHLPGLVDARRSATNVCHRVRNVCALRLLGLAREVLSCHLADARALPDGLAGEARSASTGRETVS